MKTDKKYKQKGKRLGSAGGFFNQLMSSNSSVPVVGEGATVLLYSDRNAYEVISVNEAKKQCVIQRYFVKRVDGGGMSEAQNYEYKELEEHKRTLQYRWGGWKEVHDVICFTKEALEKYGDHTPEIFAAYRETGGEYNGTFPSSVIEGLTHKSHTYQKISIIFGVRQEYYDYSI